MLNPTVWISATVSGTVHVVGVGCWIVSDRDIAQVVVLIRVTTVITSIILGNVLGHGWRTCRCRSRDATRAGSEHTDINPVVQREIIVTVSDIMLADKAGLRIFLFRCSVFNIFGVKGEFFGVGQEAFSIAPAHERSDDNKHDDQKYQSGEPKHKTRKGFIFKETFRFGHGDFAWGRTSGRACLCDRGGSIWFAGREQWSLRGCE